MTHCNNVDEVIFPQSVQDGVYGVFGNSELQALHAATDIHHYDDVFRRRSSLNVPAVVRETKNEPWTKTAAIPSYIKDKEASQASSKPTYESYLFCASDNLIVY